MSIKGFGAGVFIDIDKAKAMRKDDNTTSVRYGRLSRDDLRKIPVKKDLFQISATAAGGITVDDATMALEIPSESFTEINKWIPKLNIGLSPGVNAVDAIVKKTITVGSPTPSPSSRRLDQTTHTPTSRTIVGGLYEADLRRLERTIPSDAHRALRMLCEDTVLPDGFDPEANCPVEEGGFACARLADIRLDANKIVELVEPILKKIVNGKDGAFDEIIIPMLFLNDPVPGVSELTGKE